jgi:hypothetical protein
MWQYTAFTMHAALMRLTFVDVTFCMVSSSAFFMLVWQICETVLYIQFETLVVISYYFWCKSFEVFKYDHALCTKC